MIFRDILFSEGGKVRKMRPRYEVGVMTFCGRPVCRPLQWIRGEYKTTAILNGKSSCRISRCILHSVEATEACPIRPGARTSHLMMIMYSRKLHP